MLQKQEIDDYTNRTRKRARDHFEQLHLCGCAEDRKANRKCGMKQRWSKNLTTFDRIPTSELESIVSYPGGDAIGDLVWLPLPISSVRD
jgi:hypothetical protein